jgi:hypothetical protein
MNQCDRVLEYLGSGKSITSVDAWRELGITRLSARISELKSVGHPISKKTIKVPNRYAEVCSVAEYSMEAANAD